MTRLSDIDFLSIEVKYHWEFQSKKCHYQSNSFSKKILILLDKQISKILCYLFFIKD